MIKSTLELCLAQIARVAPTIRNFKTKSIKPKLLELRFFLFIVKIANIRVNIDLF